MQIGFTQRRQRKHQESEVIKLPDVQHMRPKNPHENNCDAVCIRPKNRPCDERPLQNELLKLASTTSHPDFNSSANKAVCCVVGPGSLGQNGMVECHPATSGVLDTVTLGCAHVNR